MECCVAVIVGASNVHVADKRFQHFRSSVARRQVEISVSVEIGRSSVGAERQKTTDLVYLAGLDGDLITDVNNNSRFIIFAYLVLSPSALLTFFTLESPVSHVDIHITY